MGKGKKTKQNTTSDCLSLIGFLVLQHTTRDRVIYHEQVCFAYGSGAWAVQECGSPMYQYLILYWKLEVSTWVKSGDVPVIPAFR